jgi:cytochrome c5
MKSFSLMILGACALLASCAGPRQAPLPSVEMSARSGKPLTTLQRGHAVYLAQCTRCHEAKLPETITHEDWHIVVPGMAWNAGISKADEKAVLAYLLAAKQG